jgi:hypothetical protein
VNIEIIKYIKLIQKHPIKNKIENSIRPMTFSDFESGYYWFQGTGFFIQYGKDIIFLSARHNFIKKDLYREDGNFINLQKNIENFFIIKNLYFCDLKNNDERIQSEIVNVFIHSVLPKDTQELALIGLSDEDLNDVAVITFTKKFSDDFLDKNNFIKLNYSAAIRTNHKDDAQSPEVDDTVFVSGYCIGDDKNYINCIEIDDDGICKQSEMSLNRNYVIGKIVKKDDSAFQDVRYINKVEVTENFGLETLNGFSGSPVFLIKNDDIKFTGMIIRGGKKYFYFINVDFIRTYLMKNDIEMMQLGLAPSNNKMFEEVKKILDENNIQVIDKDEEKEALSFQVKDSMFVISYKYMCHIFVLEILLRNIEMMTHENFNLLADICFHIHETDKYDLMKKFFDKVPITDSVISQLKEKYIILIQKGKKFSYEDIFDINV